MNRRTFLKTTALAATARPLAAVEPFKRAGKPSFQIALAAYSFRDNFIHNNRGGAVKKTGEEGALDMAKFIDYCADHQCAAELTSYFFADDTDYTAIRRHAFLRGVDITGTAVGNNFALPDGAERDQQIKDVKAWIDRAALMGAPHIRVFAGAAPKGSDEAAARKMCISALEECADYAGKFGIFLGIENHGGIVARPEGLLEIIQAVKSKWLGINLDTGNFHTEDPYADLAKCAPWAVNVQLKVEMKPADKPTEFVDIDRAVKILTDANYQGYVALEYEAKEDASAAVPEWLEKLRAALS
jgi:sugar phosphate isomerase/epimerase